MREVTFDNLVDSCGGSVKLFDIMKHPELLSVKIEPTEKIYDDESDEVIASDLGYTVWSSDLNEGHSVWEWVKILGLLAAGDSFANELYTEVIESNFQEV